jgi:hypothetical protein
MSSSYLVIYGLLVHPSFSNHQRGIFVSKNPILSFFPESFVYLFVCTFPKKTSALHGAGSVVFGVYFGG